ncbi:MAG: HEAT repeat domain-containing protein [Planctomycetes bacterium]|nr:HEAT repeat domain-containing protein [Planctomycetota bacterium]
MRHIVVALVLLGAAAPAHAQGKEISWIDGKLDQDFSETAAQSRHRTMVFFTARWNSDCQFLRQTVFSDKDIVGLAQEWDCILVDLSDTQDYTRARGRHRLAGIPTLRFYSEDGAMVDELVATTDAGVITRKLRGETALWKARAINLDPNKWHDTHRVFLRNGNVIDGQLKELTEEVAVLQWDPQTEVQIERQNLLRVEWITIHRVDDAPKRVDQPVEKKHCPRCGTELRGDVCTTCVIKRARPPEPEPQPVSPDVSQQADQIIERIKSATNKDQAIEDLAKAGPETLVYAASLVDQLPPDTALWVLTAITRVREMQAAPTLRKKLATIRDSEVLMTATYALSALQDTEATPEIAKLLEHSSVAVRGAAVEALGHLGDEGVLRDLCAAAVEADKTVRLKATSALVALVRKLNAEASVTITLQAVAGEAPEPQRDQVPLILAQLGVQEAVPLLLDYLRSEDADLRFNAVNALGDLAASDACESFRAMLEVEREPRVKAQICSTLAKLKDTASVPMLIELMADDQDAAVRLASHRALQQLTRQAFGPEYDQWKKWWNVQRPGSPEGE